MTNRSRLECLRVKRMHLSCSIALHLAIYLLHRVLSSAVFFSPIHPHQHHHDDRIVLNCIHISVYQNFSLIFFGDGVFDYQKTTSMSLCCYTTINWKKIEQMPVCQSSKNWFYFFLWNVFFIHSHILSSYRTQILIVWKGNHVKKVCGFDVISFCGQKMHVTRLQLWFFVWVQ